MRHNPARVLNLRVPPDIRPRLDALARARQTSRHHVAVSALLSGVDRLEAGGDVASGTEPLAGAAEPPAVGAAAVRAAGAPEGLAAAGSVAVAVGEAEAPGGGAASEVAAAPAVGAPVAHPASETAPRSAGMMGWWRSESLPGAAGSVTP